MRVYISTPIEIVYMQLHLSFEFKVKFFYVLQSEILLYSR